MIEKPKGELVAVKIASIGEFCGGCRFVDVYGYCSLFGGKLKWGGEHRERKLRCQQCIDATIAHGAGSEQKEGVR